MIKEDDLSVLLTLDLLTRAHSVLVCSVQVRIHIDDLPISPVPEEKSRVGVGINLEVRGVVVLDLLTLPRVEAQIGHFGLNLLSL